MGRLVFMAMLMLACVGVIVPMLDQASAPDVTLAEVRAEPDAVPGTRRTEIRADGAGHFYVRTNVNGRTAEMLADTGATVVALRASEARRLGVPVDPSAFTARVATANGEIAAARVRLASLEVENIRVANVDAVVLPDEALGTNLLGMSFLKRLSRFEVGDNRLLMVE